MGAKSLLTFLGWICLSLGIIGCTSIFMLSDLLLFIDWPTRIILAISTLLSCWITGAILLGMAEGLNKLDSIHWWVRADAVSVKKEVG